MYYKKFLICLFFLVLSTNSYAGTWSDWENANASQLKISIDSNISDIIGDTNINSWKSDGKLKGGKKGFHSWSEKLTNTITLYISHYKLPSGWFISGSDNDRKYLIRQNAYMLNIEKKNNPIKKLNKKEIERYRDTEGVVVAYTTYDYLNKVCVIFFKEYYKSDSGYTDVANADETITVVLCKKSLQENEVISLIESINRK